MSNSKSKVMGSTQSKQQLLLMLLPIILFAAQSSEAQPFPNCTTNCGSLQIPYPFGTTEGCYLDPSFLITCNHTNSPPTPFLPRSNTITVLNISLDGELTISSSVAKDCYNARGKLMSQNTTRLNLTHFYFSSTRNKLTVIGCDTLGLIRGFGSQGKNYTTGCLPLCNRLNDIANSRCSGTGCCEARIPQGLSTVRFATGSATIDNHTSAHGFNPCGYGFLVEEGAYDFVNTDVQNLQRTEFPVVLDWAVGNKTCEEAEKDHSSYACKSGNSYCYNSTNGPGYRCNCSDGFKGNPYLLDGYKEINECLESNGCINGATCQKFHGSYNCSCPEGQVGDGKVDGTGCRPEVNTTSGIMVVLIIALSVSVGVLALLMASFYVYWGMKKRKLLKLKENFFQQNGGILLQQQIARHTGSRETVKVFAVEELKKATNNFDQGRVLGQGGYGTVYKGVLQENRIVAIKKSKISDPNQLEQFINEVIVLSQINHRNVVKLLGCCLETEVPLLVYEFIPNGTVSEHLHDQSETLRVRLSWKTRLRIATETAGALAYLHSSTSTPIIHRDVKTTNILLDSDLTAKVSDFGASRLVPLDQTQITTLVQGTLGYLDPEYFHTSQLTEKSDVYSFGVVLAELLTGKKALSFNRPENDRNLSLYFVSSMKERRLLDIVDPQIITETNVEQLTEVANIARRCLGVKGEERPTMKEVAIELEGVRITEKNRWKSVNLSSDETEYLLNEDQFYSNLGIDVGIGKSGTSKGIDSLNPIPMTLGGGR